MFFNPFLFGGFNNPSQQMQGFNYGFNPFRFPGFFGQSPAQPMSGLGLSQVGTSIPNLRVPSQGRQVKPPVPLQSQTPKRNPQQAISPSRAQLIRENAGFQGPMRPLWQRR